MSFEILNFFYNLIANFNSANSYVHKGMSSFYYEISRK